MPIDVVPTVTVHSYEVVGNEGEGVTVQWAEGAHDITLVIQTSGEQRIIRLSEMNAAKLGYGLAQAVGRMREGRLR